MLLFTDVGGFYDKTGGPISGTVRVQAQSYSDVRDEGLESGTITLDFGSSNNFKMTLTGTSTLGAPTNASGGQSGSIFILQDGTGSRTLAYNAVFAFAGGTAPTYYDCMGRMHFCITFRTKYDYYERQF